MESVRTLVQIADRQHGHSSKMMTKAETLETVDENDDAFRKTDVETHTFPIGSDLRL